MTDDRGVDVAIEAVGIPATFDFCQKIIGIDGTVANCGVHGKPVEFDLDKLLDSQHQCNNWFGIYKYHSTIC